MSIGPVSTATQVVSTYDINGTSGIQPDEISVQFIMDFLGKSDRVQDEIVAQVGEEARESLSLQTSIIASENKHDSPWDKQTIRRARRAVKYREEPQLKGATKLDGYEMQGYSYIPLGSKSRSDTVRVFC